MIVPMMTPRSTTLDRATVVAVHHVFTTFHLVGNCVAQRPWTSFPVAPDLAVLQTFRHMAKSALKSTLLFFNFNPRVTIHLFLHK